MPLAADQPETEMFLPSPQFMRLTGIIYKQINAAARKPLSNAWLTQLGLAFGLIPYQIQSSKSCLKYFIHTHTNQCKTNFF